VPSDASNLSGEWSGEFSYPRHRGPTTPFLAQLEDRGGRLTGTIVEPDIISGGTTAASIAGLRHGSSVDFTKAYGPAAPFGYETPVDYVGQVSADGNTVSGVWSLLDMDGRFEMRREQEIGEVVETEEAVAQPEVLPGR
jgi:hypothetical protein